MTIRVVMADDHLIVREGLRFVISAEPDIEVVAECADGAEAIALTAQLRPDVVLMDLRMPGTDGVTAVMQIMAVSPCPVLILTTYDTDGDVTRAIAAGAAGYLLKDLSRDELVRAIRAAARGETVLATPIASKLANQLSGKAPSLTVRETEVLQRIAEGMSNPQIGASLFISEATVKSHVMRIFVKLDVDDRTAAVTRAIARGILPPP